MIQNYRKPLENVTFCLSTTLYFNFSVFPSFLVLCLRLPVFPLISTDYCSTDKVSSTWSATTPFREAFSFPGLRTASILSLASILCTFFTFWYHNLPPLHYSTRDTEDFLAHAHQQTYPRIPTFIMGILLGKSLALHNKPMKMLKDKAITCWFLTAAIIFVCFYGRLSAVVTLGEEERGSVKTSIPESPNPFQTTLICSSFHSPSSSLELRHLVGHLRLSAQPGTRRNFLDE